VMIVYIVGITFELAVPERLSLINLSPIYVISINYWGLVNEILYVNVEERIR